MTQYYQLSDDYDLADKFLKEGETLAAWLWMPSKQLRTFSITDGKLFIDGLNPPSDFTYEKYLVQFLLPIPDPTIELQASLTELQLQCVKLRSKLAEYTRPFPERTILTYEDIETLQDLSVRDEQTILALQHSLKLALDECDELRNDITVANTVIEELNQKIKAISLKSEIKQETIERLTKELETRYRTIAILEENFTRSNRDRLSQLTAIMSMVQALEETPLQKHGGAIYLIKRVLFEAICKLDPSQAIEL